MRTRIIMTASALFLAILGLASTFLPQEILAGLHQPNGAVLSLVIQILGALYLGFAMLNWMAKESIIGGIYNRPISIANLVHFLVAALALGKGVMAGPRDPALVAIAALYALFALAFSSVVFTSPVKAAE
jgi:hypothetical protein